jgi:hypothetical protein
MALTLRGIKHEVKPLLDAAKRQLKASKLWLQQNAEYNDEEFQERKQEALSEDRNREVRQFLQYDETSDSEEDDDDDDDDNDDDKATAPIPKITVPPPKITVPMKKIIVPMLRKEAATAKGKLFQSLRKEVARSAIVQAARRKKVINSRLVNIIYPQLTFI